MDNLPMILMIFAFVIFVLGAWWDPEPYRWKIISAGLAFYVLAHIISGLGSMHLIH